MNYTLIREYICNVTLFVMLEMFLCCGAMLKALIIFIINAKLVSNKHIFLAK
jgi:hypothetical protein